MKISRYAILIIVLPALFFSGCITEDVIRSDNTNVFEIEVNNTNLAPTIGNETLGTGERIQNVIYFANNSPIELFVFGHALSAGDTAELHLFINGTKVSDTSQKAIGVADQINSTIIATIPRYASYMIQANDIHHYEWREYRILSGQNGSVDINNFYNNTSVSDLKVNKSGDSMTGNLSITMTTGTRPVLNVTNPNTPNSAANSTIVSRTSGVQGLAILNTAASSSGQGAGVQAYHDDGAFLAAGDRLGFFLFGSAYDSSHSNISNTAGFAATATSTWNATNRGTNFIAYVTRDNSTTRTTAYTIASSGEMTINAYSGSGNDYACFNSAGKLYRSDVACV